VSLSKHQSPHRPGDTSLTALRKRHERREQRRRLKGTAMNRNVVKGTIGAAMVAAGIAGIALVSASGPEKVTYQGYANPVPCVETVEQVLVCGSPVASPIATPTLAPVDVVLVTPTSEIEGITELPSTGTGDTAK
jgi:hypothetical protein